MLVAESLIEAIALQNNLTIALLVHILPNLRTYKKNANLEHSIQDSKCLLEKNKKVKCALKLTSFFNHTNSRELLLTLSGVTK